MYISFLVFLCTCLQRNGMYTYQKQFKKIDQKHSLRIEIKPNQLISARRPELIGINKNLVDIPVPSDRRFEIIKAKKWRNIWTLQENVFKNCNTKVKAIINIVEKIMRELEIGGSIQHSTTKNSKATQKIPGAVENFLKLGVEWKPPLTTGTKNRQ